MALRTGDRVGSMVARQREITVIAALSGSPDYTSGRGGEDSPPVGSHVQPLRRAAIGYLGGRGAAFKRILPYLLSVVTCLIFCEN